MYIVCILSVYNLYMFAGFIHALYNLIVPAFSYVFVCVKCFRPLRCWCIWLRFVSIFVCARCFSAYVHSCMHLIVLYWRCVGCMFVKCYPKYSLLLRWTEEQRLSTLQNVMISFKWTRKADKTNDYRSLNKLSICTIEGTTIIIYDLCVFFWYWSPLQKFSWDFIQHKIINITVLYFTVRVKRFGVSTVNAWCENTKRRKSRDKSSCGNEIIYMTNSST